MQVVGFVIRVPWRDSCRSKNHRHRRAIHYIHGGAEQHALQQVFRDGGTVDGYIGVGITWDVVKGDTSGFLPKPNGINSLPYPRPLPLFLQPPVLKKPISPDLFPFLALGQRVHPGRDTLYGRS